MQSSKPCAAFCDTSFKNKNVTASEASAQITRHGCQNKMAKSGVPQVILSILPVALQNDVHYLYRTINSSAKCSKQQGAVFLPGCDLVRRLVKYLFSHGVGRFCVLESHISIMPLVRLCFFFFFFFLLESVYTIWTPPPLFGVFGVIS